MVNCSLSFHSDPQGKIHQMYNLTLRICALALGTDVSRLDNLLSHLIYF